MAEVVLGGHILAHPIGGSEQLTVGGKATQAVGRPIIVNDRQERLLLGVQSLRRPRGRSYGQHREHDQ